MRESASGGLRRTPLHALHLELGARMVAFAGYEMPLSYSGGILAEHRQCRGKAALFDVSHMGQAWLAADSDVAGALETQVCGDIAGLTPGAMRYTMLLADDGGTVDDLIVTRPDASERLALVVNASRKETDYRRLAERLAGSARIEAADGLALLALQGPRAAMALAALCPAAVELRFMRSAQLALDGIACTVGRSGYTGEDGFEISMPANRAEDVARRLLAHPEVGPAGLGARDVLRLEAGLCLWGQDLDETTSPVEAGLEWTIPRRRRTAADFPGAKRILRELAEGPPRCRVGLRPAGRVPARAGAAILDRRGRPVGKVTSGGFSPGLGAPVAMGYVDRAHSEPDTELALSVRGRNALCRVAALPFVARRAGGPGSGRPGG